MKRLAVAVAQVMVHHAHSVSSISIQLLDQFPKGIFFC